MKLLLDENLPVRLKYRFSESLSVSTVSDENWSGVKDGVLLSLMKSSGFTVLVTSDRHLSKQQNLAGHGVVVVLLLTHSNRYEVLRESIAEIEKQLPPSIDHGVIEIDLRK